VTAEKQLRARRRAEKIELAELTELEGDTDRSRPELEGDTDKSDTRKQQSKK
jgi:hypothetical protein